MKGGGFLKGDEGQNAEADWTRLASELDGCFSELADSDCDLCRAKDYLIDERSRPQKQVVRNGGPTFENAGNAGGSDLNELIISVKRVRNNLFHGGKAWSGENNSRDLELIRMASKVLKHLMDLSESLKRGSRQ